MKIHEYQAKEIFTRYGIPVPKNKMVESAEAIDGALREIGGDTFVVKAQIHAGGRGKAGGVRVAQGASEAARIAREMLGAKLVTRQSGPQGRVVRKISLDAAVAIDREYYLAVTLDRAKARGVILSSQAGGMDIEEVAHTQPEKINKTYFDLVFGLASYQAREVALGLGKDPAFVKAVTQIVQKLTEIFVRLDASLVEINPLVLTRDGAVTAIDAKIDFEDNGLYRHPEVGALRDPLEEDPREVEAKKYNLNYVGLDGSVGCMVNGAGLAMATMDVIMLAGGMPANFLDVGGGAKVDQVKAAFKIILSDERVKSILVNIFGGIMKCDVVADGIIQAARDVQLRVPLVVRLEGTNVEKGKELLRQSGIRITPAEGLSQAASLAVQLAGKS
ncbi:MAG: ADP-forming succinate--CoA ligase subunit beta [Candidatus Omnitrophica bacterium]|nr:ADP-forming succinate--CoA ligase subunit beta [Candidatus Omnitrophota bacterium]